MKTFKNIFALLFVTASFLSCSDSNDDDFIEDNPVAGLYKIYEFSETDHSVEVYSEKQNLEVGYNELSLRIRDKSDNSYITDADPTWMPIMEMENMAHSAPHSSLKNSDTASVYKGYLVFQMAGNESENWNLTLNYTYKGELFSASHKVDVRQPSDGLRKVQVFTGNDENRYILAYVNPKTPEVAINDMQAVLFEMEDMMTFPVVKDYSIVIDPRMPGMGNHSSPNNRDMVYDASSGMYKGKLSLTMTGFWKINMKLFSKEGELIKGEDVSDDVPNSSLYFELEF